MGYEIETDVGGVWRERSTIIKENTPPTKKKPKTQKNKNQQTTNKNTQPRFFTPKQSINIGAVSPWVYSVMYVFVYKHSFFLA